MDKKRLFSLSIAFLILIFLIQLDINDVFVKGFKADSVQYDMLWNEDIVGIVDISDSAVPVEFVPQKNHFAGFVLYFENSEYKEGQVDLGIYSESGKLLDSIEVPLSEISQEHTLIVKTNKNLYSGVKYIATIVADGTNQPVNMLFADSDYNSKESDSNLLIGYGYKENVFTNAGKLIISLGVIFAGLVIIALIYGRKGIFERIFWIGIIGVAVNILTWEYNFCSLGFNNEYFEGFDSTSERLVVISVELDKEGMFNSDWTGLNMYEDASGAWFEADKLSMTDDNWLDGYNRKDPLIVLDAIPFVESKALVGNSILFENGDIYPIIDVALIDRYVVIALDSGRPLNPWKYGQIRNIRFVDGNGELLQKGVHSNYYSQYGLQGKVARVLGKVLELDIIRAIVAYMCAMVFVLIVWLIYNKYDAVLASVFAVVFLLSPWIVNFANNLYWVEYTWFIPMVFGLLCAWKGNNSKIRRICYIGIGASICIKSLCGYEYISAVMLGSIAFLLAELAEAIYLRNDRIKELFTTIFISGMSALTGFFVALCVHARIKPAAEGNIIKGLSIIFKEDALRRTYGAGADYTSQLVGAEKIAVTTSVWEVLARYFRFDTNIIDGISGRLFPFLCILAVIITVIGLAKKKYDIRIVSLLVIEFLLSISWLVLAKTHSYIHKHLNFVLWYFGFVQMCIYIVIKPVVCNVADYLKKQRTSKMKGDE